MARLRENVLVEVFFAVESEREDDGRWIGLFVLTIDGDDAGTVLAEEGGLGCEVMHEGSGHGEGSSEGEGRQQINGRTPYEVLYKAVLDLVDLRAFGAVCVIVEPREKLKKLMNGKAAREPWAGPHTCAISMRCTCTEGSVLWLLCGPAELTRCGRGLQIFSTFDIKHALNYGLLTLQYN